MPNRPILNPSGLISSAEAGPASSITWLRFSSFGYFWSTRLFIAFFPFQEADELTEPYRVARMTALNAESSIHLVVPGSSQILIPVVRITFKRDFYSVRKSVLKVGTGKAPGNGAQAKGTLYTVWGLLPGVQGPLGSDFSASWDF